jgi:hypothetical protein
MADPNVTTAPTPDTPLSPLMQWLIPLAGAAMTAYSPGHLGQGVGAFGQLFGQISALKNQQNARNAMNALTSQTETTPGTTTMQPSAGEGNDTGASTSLTDPSFASAASTLANPTPYTSPSWATAGATPGMLDKKAAVASGMGLGLQDPTPTSNLLPGGGPATSGSSAEKDVSSATYSDTGSPDAAAAKAAAITTPTTTTKKIPSMMDLVGALAPYYPEQAANLASTALWHEAMFGTRQNIANQNNATKIATNAASNTTRLAAADVVKQWRMNQSQEGTFRNLYDQNPSVDPNTLAYAVKTGDFSAIGASPLAQARINSLNNPAAQVVPVTVNGSTQVVGVNRRTMQATPVQMPGAQTVQPGNQQTVDAATQQKAMAENDNALAAYGKATAVLNSHNPDDAVALGLARRTLVATYRKNATAAGMDPKEIDAIAAGKTQPNTSAPQQQVSIGQTATNPTTGERVRWNGSQWQPIGLVNGQWVPINNQQP